MTVPILPWLGRVPGSVFSVVVVAFGAAISPPTSRFSGTYILPQTWRITTATVRRFHLVSRTPGYDALLECKRGKREGDPDHLFTLNGAELVGLTSEISGCRIWP